jgi:hypothetical protein
MIVGIVGSQLYPRPDIVKRFARCLPKGTQFVSGGADGPDTWAEEEVLRFPLTFPSPRIFRPDEALIASLTPKIGRYQAFSAAAQRRNDEIAAACDWLVAFLFDDSPGTTYTADKAARLGKLVWAYRWPDVPRYAAAGAVERGDDGLPVSLSFGVERPLPPRDWKPEKKAPPQPEQLGLFGPAKGGKP